MTHDLHVYGRKYLRIKVENPRDRQTWENKNTTTKRATQTTTIKTKKVDQHILHKNQDQTQVLRKGKRFLLRIQQNYIDQLVTLKKIYHPQQCFNPYCKSINSYF